MARRLLNLEILLAAENEQRRCLARQRVIRDRSRAFELNDLKFRHLFRLHRHLVIQLCGELEETLSGVRRTAIPVDTKILVALRFYAIGSYQLGIGQDLYLAVSQPTVSRCVNDVSEAIVRKYTSKYIKFPTTEIQQEAIKQRFYTETGFPGVIGAIDCTHVAIVTPKTTDEEYREYLYVNRKGYHSINVQLVCDFDLIILNVNAKFPGSAHDSHIYRTSKVSNFLEGSYRSGTLRNSWLVGDSGYGLTPWLMVPVSRPRADSAESRYNVAHASARHIIECVNGVLKQRFRCLLKDRVLHYAPTQASNIINACCILHNICRLNGVPDEEFQNVNNMPIPDRIFPPDEVPRGDNWQRIGAQVQQRLIRRFE